MSGSLLTQIKKENMIAPIQMIAREVSALGGDLNRSMQHMR